MAAMMLIRWSTLYCFFFDECKMDIWIIKLTCKIGNHSTWWTDHSNKWGNQGWSCLTQCLCQNLLHSQLCSHTCVPTPQNCGEVLNYQKKANTFLPTCSRLPHISSKDRMTWDNPRKHIYTSLCHGFLSHSQRWQEDSIQCWLLLLRSQEIPDSSYAGKNEGFQLNASNSKLENVKKQAIWKNSLCWRSATARLNGI